MINKKYLSLVFSFILLSSMSGFTPISAQQNVYIISNNIDVVAKPILEDYFRGYGLFPEFLAPDDINQIKGARLLIILGGPDAPFGTGQLASRYLDSLEIAFIRQKDQRFTFIKNDIFGHADRVIIIAGSEREKTYEEIFNLVNGSNVSFQTEIQQASEGRVQIRDLPLILASISFTTITVDNIAHIYLKIQNFGRGKATNVIVEISDDYYSNFSLQSVDPVRRVDGNKFYIGDMEGGEVLELDITLRAKQSGIYTCKRNTTLQRTRH
ncbi:MAG: hypothetical protein APG10_00999 [Candidatus Methanofastidiosum methylothiophilum]|uniref:S-layer protein C-terminal domain-containing protein n=1 Tax=Candidatus Methanofastidiosum methylothiophilum TaxID=1705564 RepID=A0A150IJW9_9EURY|nr:MAG: hypothetical protein APG10_00999 [Candidatus Methanofastidiosum methylthiophilus]